MVLWYENTSLYKVFKEENICQNKKITIIYRYVSKVKWHNIKNLLPKIFEKHRKI